MLHNKTVAVVVPAYNEEKQIGKVIETMPDFVDRIVVVNDASKDKTKEIVEKYLNNGNSSQVCIKAEKSKFERTEYERAEIVAEDLQVKELKKFPPFELTNKDPENSRIILINHLKNSGKGATIATGYKWCQINNIECTATMDGDGQMDPKELESICTPVVNGEVDYVKGNRLIHRSAFFVIPKIRYFGNSILSLLTKIASGYWRVSDTQTGYSAISLAALRAIRIHKIYPRYGYPNDMLVKLNIAFCTVMEVPIKPVYDIGEKSKMKIYKVVPKITWLLFKSFLSRLYVKYLFRDFHPLFLLYHLAFALILIDIPFIYQAVVSLGDATLPLQNLLIFTLLTITGFQSLFFAMWMDMMDNEKLYK